MGLAKFLAVVVLLGIGAVIVASATDDGTSGSSSAASCSTRPSSDRTPLWSAALVLDRLGDSDAAKETAESGVKETGGLPHDPETCDEIRGLLTPEGQSFTDRVNQAVKDWWWLMAIAVFAVVALLGYVLRRRWWRENRWIPRVSLQVAAADADATGLDIGAQVGGLVRTQLLLLESNDVGPRVGYVTAADADVDVPPIDEVPGKAQWLIALVQWLGRRNRLSLTMTIAQARSGRSQAIAHIREPSGRTTIRADRAPRTVVIEQAAASPVTETTYLALATPLVAWTLFQLKEITNEAAALRQEVGTSNWQAWANLQEGVAALEDGAVDQALERFESAHQHDPSPSFFELRLNYAYALARSEDAGNWEQALIELAALAEATAP